MYFGIFLPTPVVHIETLLLNKDKKLQFRRYCSSFLRVASSLNENTLFRRCEFASALLCCVSFFNLLLSVSLNLVAYRSSSTIFAINHVVLSSPVRYSCNYRNTSNALCSESLYSSVLLYTKKQVINSLSLPFLVVLSTKKANVRKRNVCVEYLCHGLHSAFMQICIRKSKSIWWYIANSCTVVYYELSENPAM